MQVQETKVFSFIFPYLDGSLKSFQVASESQQEAAALLKEWLSKAQLELSMLFPQVAPKKENTSEFSQMQMSLLEDLATSCKLDMSNLSKSIEEATKLPMTSANFKKIIPILEGLRDGTT